MIQTILHCQTDTLVENIIQSPAFTGITKAMKSRTDLTLGDHADCMYQWSAITRVFYLSGQQLLTTISLELLGEYEENNINAIERLKHIRARVDAVFADDGGHCRALPRAEELPGFETRHTRVHYEMFESDIALPLREASGKIGIVLRPATLSLMKSMKEGFGKSIEEGFSWLLIVELIAEEIVEKMHPYLTIIKKDGVPFFSKEQLFYCYYHILLEKQHAGDVKEGVRVVADTTERMQILEQAVEKALISWAHFWASQAQIGE